MWRPFLSRIIEAPRRGHIQGGGAAAVPAPRTGHSAVGTLLGGRPCVVLYGGDTRAQGGGAVCCLSDQLYHRRPIPPFHLPFRKHVWAGQPVSPSLPIARRTCPHLARVAWD
eukprot:COSAG01_NODE_676_length_14324_cov_17.420105_12_plen_112_part_00